MNIEITQEDIDAVAEEFLDNYNTSLERENAMLQEIVDLRNKVSSLENDIEGLKDRLEYAYEELAGEDY